MEYSCRPTKSIPKENQFKILNKIYQTYLVSTTKVMARQAIVWTSDGLTHWLIYAPQGVNELS